MNILGYEEMAYDGGTRAREFLKKNFIWWRMFWCDGCV